MAVHAAQFVIELNDVLTNNLDNLPDKLKRPIDKISEYVLVTIVKFYAVIDHCR